MDPLGCSAPEPVTYYAGFEHSDMPKKSGLSPTYYALNGSSSAISHPHLTTNYPLPEATQEEPMSSIMHNPPGGTVTKACNCSPKFRQVLG